MPSISLMAATVLNSAQAVNMIVFIIRAFVRMRADLAANSAILKRQAEIYRTLLLRDSHDSGVWATKSLSPLTSAATFLWTATEPRRDKSS